MENERAAEEAGTVDVRARAHMLAGENCALSLLNAFVDDPRVGPGVEPAVGLGLGGGFGGSGALCGAVNAAGLLLGAAVGARGAVTCGNESKVGQRAVNEAVSRLRRDFCMRYGSCDCTPILKGKPKLSPRKPWCAELVAWTAAWLDRELGPGAAGTTGTAGADAAAE
ncbi:MAG: C-GCAxxG-C-C family protein [Actinomycetes bacterium]|jgi:hypothetical protein|nr:C-GCAxxG-C-C family protein [Actinomycetes bacterium]